MKNKLIIIALVIGLFVACNRDEYDAPNSFSDVSWYTTAFNSTTPQGLNINDFASFSNLSQGAISNKWIIEDGSFFLKGPITRKDTALLENFIINPIALETEEETAHVLFTKSGLRNVRLLSIFKDSVAFRGANDFVFPAKPVDGNWVIDTTFVVDVYDTIVPKILIRQDGIVVPHESETDVITLEAGTSLEFVDVSEIGRPDTWSWKIAGVTNPDSLAVIQFNRLGNFKGNVTIRRAGENVPLDFENYKIPATITVIPSTQPLVFSAPIVELEDQTIDLSFTGEFAPFASQVPFFTVTVNGTPFTIASITPKSGDGTTLQIKLQDPIYRADVITVSYAGGSLITTDARSLSDFTDEPVSMFQHEAVLYDFEDGTDNWTINSTPNKTGDIVEVSTDVAASGSSSLKFTVPSGGNWSGFENLIDQYSLDAGVVYQIEYKIYKVAPTGINMNGPWINQAGQTKNQFWNNTVRDAPIETWVTVSPGGRYTATASADDFETYIRHNGSGVLYFDDIRVMAVDDRP